MYWSLFFGLPNPCGSWHSSVMHLIALLLALFFFLPVQEISVRQSIRSAFEFLYLLVLNAAQKCRFAPTCQNSCKPNIYTGYGNRNCRGEIQATLSMSSQFILVNLSYQFPKSLTIRAGTR